MYEWRLVRDEGVQCCRACDIVRRRCDERLMDEEAIGSMTSRYELIVDCTHE